MIKDISKRCNERSKEINKIKELQLYMCVQNFYHPYIIENDIVSRWKTIHDQRFYVIFVNREKEWEEKGKRGKQNNRFIKTECRETSDKQINS